MLFQCISKRHALAISLAMCAFMILGVIPSAAAEKEPALADRADILYFTSFESGDWITAWSDTGQRDNYRIAEPPQPFDGKALEIRIQKGGHYGIAPHFRFKDHLGEYPQEMYARYYIYLADDWHGYGGKAPGWSGTEAAGWGGKPSDGTNGWSARGGMASNKDGTFRLSYYTYHARMKGKYGDSYHWSGEAANLEPGKWHCIEEYCKINTPGEADGILRAWVNGALVLDKTDVCMRNTAQLHLKSFWMNFYHGGKQPSDQERRVYIDNFVLATKGRIGPKDAK